MTKDQIQIGKVYAVKVSGAISPVRIDCPNPYNAKRGWRGTNLRTNRKVFVLSARSARYELERNPETGKWRESSSSRKALVVEATEKINGGNVNG